MLNDWKKCLLAMGFHFVQEEMEKLILHLIVLNNLLSHVDFTISLPKHSQSNGEVEKAVENLNEF